MVSNVVTIGDKIDIYRIGDNGEKENKPAYVSQVLDFIDEDKAKIGMPVMEGRVIPLEVEDKYILCFYTMKGLYQCSAVIIDRYKDGNLNLLVVRFLTDVVKFQRRQFYRLECAIEIRCRLVSQLELILEDTIVKNEFQSEKEKLECYDEFNRLKSQWYPAVITDISGGGARFNSACLFRQEDMIKIDIALEISSKIAEYELKSNIISSIPAANRPKVFESRVEFSEITTEERETIIRFVFEEERKKRKREKGLM